MGLRIIWLAFCAVIAACSGGDTANDSGAAPPDAGLPTAPAAPIKINQLGFYPHGPKIGVVPAVAAETFALISEEGATVFSGDLSAARNWPHAQDNVRLADFSSYLTPGSYRLQVDGLAPSDFFSIADDVHSSLNQAALKAYYYNRSGVALTSPYAGRWARAAGHPDTRVAVHASAARPPGTLISSAMGWYDAGDYNKYIVNSGITTYTLLAAYEHFPQHYRGQHLNIPESGNTLPDILDEALWNIRWMLSMQDAADGGVHHKLTTLAFADRVMPDRATAQRYVVQKSTAATLNFAAVMAVASRVFDSYAAELPGLAAQCREAAQRAWQWAKNHPDNAYVQPADIATGEYASPGFNDEFAWAAAELYITLDDYRYYTEFNRHRAPASVPSWSDVGTLAYISLLHHHRSLSAAADIGSIRTAFLNLADALRDSIAGSAYGVVMGRDSGDFVWGSNAVALNQSMVLLQAYRDTSALGYLYAAVANLDYVLGRNALAMSFVTGFGWRSPMRIHHRPSDADSVAEPVPGFLAGGPQPGQQDGCNYPSSLPAKSYLDHWCSYSTNEIAINWNAPLVYVTGALEAAGW